MPASAAGFLLSMTGVADDAVKGNGAIAAEAERTPPLLRRSRLDQTALSKRNINLHLRWILPGASLAQSSLEGSDAVDFDQRVARQAGDGNRCAHRRYATPMACIDGIHFVVIGYVAQVDIDLEHLLHR